MCVCVCVCMYIDILCIHKDLKGDMSPQPDVGGPRRGQVNPCNAKVQITRMKTSLKTM